MPTQFRKGRPEKWLEPEPDAEEESRSREIWFTFKRGFERTSQIRKRFKRYGPIEEVEVNWQCNFAFVLFKDLLSATKARRCAGADPRINRVAYSHRPIDNDFSVDSHRLRVASHFDVGFRHQSTFYSKYAYKPKYAEIIFDGKRKTTLIVVDSIEYLLRWNQIKELYWHQESSALVIEWDIETNPSIFKYVDKRRLRTRSNPLQLTEADRNLIICRVDAEEFGKIRKKISRKLIIKEVEELDIEDMQPKELIFPPGIRLLTALLIEVLLSFQIPKERIDNHFWKVVTTTSHRIVNAALKELFNKNQFIFYPGQALIAEIEEVKRNGIQMELYDETNEVMPVFYLDVTPTRHYLYGPYPEKSNRVLRKYELWPWHFIRINFRDDDGSKLYAINSELKRHFKKLLLNGIQLGGRVFTFLAYSQSQLRAGSCYAYTDIQHYTSEVIHNIDIIKKLGEFENSSPSKCASRIAQCFSSTTGGIKLDPSQIEYIDDIELGPFNFSDGIGKISQELASKIESSLNLSNSPSAYQIRINGCKGMVAVDPTLKGTKLVLRNSMRKFDCDENELEINEYSKYNRAFINRPMIIQLETLGVKQSAFKALQNKMLSTINTIISADQFSQPIDPDLLNFIPGDSGALLRQVAAIGFNDTFLKNLAIVHCRRALNKLIKKTRIHVPDAALLHGVLDERSVLKPDEVFVQITDPSTKKLRCITGRVMITRSPCVHPGDIRMVECVDRPELRHLKDVVVFSQKGDRPLPDMMSGGDLDGNKFMVVWDSSLFPPRTVPAMDYKATANVAKKQAVINYPNDIVKVFLQHMSNTSVGRVANLLLAHAETQPLKALSPECLKLAKLHSQAVDYPKNGVPVQIPDRLQLSSYPDYLESKIKQTFKAQSFVGQSYRLLKKKYGGDIESTVRHDPDAALIAYPGYEVWMNEANTALATYTKKMTKLCRFYNATEVEIVSGVLLGGKKNKDRRLRHRNNYEESIRAQYAHIRREFLALFNQGVTKNQRLAKASAWYTAAYSRKRNQFVSFAWSIVSTELVQIKTEVVARIKASARVRKALSKHKPLQGRSNTNDVQDTGGHDRTTRYR